MRIKMPIIKKLVQIGTSKAIIIPSAYLEYWRMKGKTICEFGVDINKKIVLTPIFKVMAEEDKTGHK